MQSQCSVRRSISLRTSRPSGRASPPTRPGPPCPRAAALPLLRALLRLRVTPPPPAPLAIRLCHTIGLLQVLRPRSRWEARGGGGGGPSLPVPLSATHCVREGRGAHRAVPREGGRGESAYEQGREGRRIMENRRKAKTWRGFGRGFHCRRLHRSSTCWDSFLGGRCYYILSDDSGTEQQIIQLKQITSNYASLSSSLLMSHF